MDRSNTLEAPGAVLSRPNEKKRYVLEEWVSDLESERSFLRRRDARSWLWWIEDSTRVKQSLADPYVAYWCISNENTNDFRFRKLPLSLVRLVDWHGEGDENDIKICEARFNAHVPQLEIELAEAPVIEDETREERKRKAFDVRCLESALKKSRRSATKKKSTPDKENGGKGKQTRTNGSGAKKGKRSREPPPHRRPRRLYLPERKCPEPLLGDTKEDKIDFFSRALLHYGSVESDTQKRLITQLEAPDPAGGLSPLLYRQGAMESAIYRVSVRDENELCGQDKEDISTTAKRVKKEKKSDC